jgi:hypothetical protein
MGLIRPRLTEYHGIFIPQKDLPFAIPHLDEDLPLYLDPFLLWKSPSQQDKALHFVIINSFNHLGALLKNGERDEALEQVILASECDEISLGLSSTGVGQRIGAKQANAVLELFERIPVYERRGFRHVEEIQFYVEGIARDRISDIAANFIKSFLIDFTMDESERLQIPLQECSIAHYYDPDQQRFVHNAPARLPVNPINGRPVLFVPKRWLRYVPWINFDEYFKAACPRDAAIDSDLPAERVRILQYNREHYGAIEEFVTTKERTAADCKNDPLFTQIPILSATRKLVQIKKLPTGKDQNADKRYEDSCVALLASLLYPNLDFAAEQSRTDSGVIIRDLIFHNNRSHLFLQELFDEYGSRQIIIELKNVAAVEREHINQLNRYMADDLGRFGVLVTRYELPRSRRKNTIDLWSGQRRCIITLNDEDLAQMVQLYESKQRDPIDVLKKKYVEFRRDCPS